MTTKSKWLAWFAAAALVPAAVAFAADDEKPLDWSWTIQPGASGEVDLLLTARIHKGWIVYASDFEPADFGPRPAKIKVTGAVGPLQALGSSKKTTKEATGEITYTYFAGTAKFKQRVHLESGATSITGTISGQTCFEESGLCALFRKDFTATVDKTP